MSHSGEPTHQQVRDLYRLIGDVRSMPTADKAARRVTLVDGICDLLGADQAFLSEFEDFMPGKAPREVGTTPGTRIDRRVVGFIGNWYATQAVEQDAIGAALYQAAATPGANIITWHGVRSGIRVDEYPAFFDLIETIRLSDVLDPMSRHEGGHMVALSLHRLGRSRPFNAREQAMGRLVAEELSWLHDTHRLDIRDLLGRSLPPRLRQLLGHLLTDRSAKQIAMVMGLSVHTTRQYTDQLYKRLGVDSREQLMVRFGPGRNLPG